MVGRLVGQETEPQRFWQSVMQLEVGLPDATAPAP